MRLRCIPPPNVNEFWPDVSIYIENASIKGPSQISPDALKIACEKGERQLWVVQDGSAVMAAAVTDTFYESDRIVLEFVAVGGREMDQWVHFEHEITDMAKRNIGANVARTICRPGIKRKLEPRGYRIRGYILERRL